MLPPPLKRHLLTLALALSAGPALAQTTVAGAGAAAPVQRTTVEQDNLWDIAGQQAPAVGATRQQYMVAVLRRNPDAFVKGNIHRLRKGVPLTLPGRDEVLAEDRTGSVALVADHLKAMRGGTVLAPLTPRAMAVDVVPQPLPSTAPPAPSAPPPPPPPASAPVVVAPPPAVPASEAPPPVEKQASAAEPVASSPVDVASGAASAVVEGSTAARVLPWLLVLGSVAGGVILWRRRRAGFQSDTAPQDFTNTLSATRSGGPRVFDISNAAAEMARSVETSQVATQLVRNDTATDSEVDVSRLMEQAGIKLEVARANLELGRVDDAKTLLQAVMREGSGRHAAEAAEMLARMG
ncbi:MAG: hypothetical protein KAX42_00030 [Sphaerotilus sp.]|nr:hypothetical protein [Sphaerotilus sp.]